MKIGAGLTVLEASSQFMETSLATILPTDLK
jgi:hypothetical protein